MKGYICKDSYFLAVAVAITLATCIAEPLIEDVIREPQTTTKTIGRQGKGKDKYKLKLDQDKYIL